VPPKAHRPCRRCSQPAFVRRASSSPVCAGSTAAPPIRSCRPWLPSRSPPTIARPAQQRSFWKHCSRRRLCLQIIHFSQSVCKMTVVPHKRRRERNRDQAQPSSGLLQPCRLISVVQVASIPVSGARLFFLPLFRPASTHRTGLCQAKATPARGRRARPGNGSALRLPVLLTTKQEFDT
jgi:hypothetical protein